MPNTTSRSIRAFDPLLRLLHWTLALTIVALIATSQLAEGFEDGPYESALWRAHILAGYLFSAALLARVLWGVVGPASARWRDLWHPDVWFTALKRLRLPGTHRSGHDPVASLAYLFAYGVMVLMAATGLLLAAGEFDVGPLVSWAGGAGWAEDLAEDPHEAGFALLLGFIALHLAALAFHQLRGERVAQSMVTGRQYDVSGVRHD